MKLFNCFILLTQVSYIPCGDLMTSKYFVFQLANSDMDFSRDTRGPLPLFNTVLSFGVSLDIKFIVLLLFHSDILKKKKSIHTELA